VCCRYRFAAGDSLVFRVNAKDTVEFESRLIRERNEVYTVVCDHISSDGRQFLRYTLESFSASERDIASPETRMRTTSPWVGRTTYIILDSLGNRIISRQGDTTRNAVSPGGAFQPTLFFTGYDSICHAPHHERSWLVTRTDSLSENACPSPIVRSTYLCSVRDSSINSTKGIALTYALTGQGSFRSITSDLGVYLQSVLDGHGAYFFDTDGSLPFSCDLKLRIKIQVRMENSRQEGTTRHSVKIQRTFLSRR
jgi:hypothetical protein